MKIANRNWLKNGPWTLMCNDQDVGGLYPAKFWSTIETHPAHSDDMAAFVIEHDWPLPGKPYPAKLGWGVRQYNFAQCGGGQKAVPEQPWAPRMVQDLGDLSQSFEWVVTGKTGDCNVMGEWFITTNAAGVRDADTVEVAQHFAPGRGAWDFANKGKYVGSFTDINGVEYELKCCGPDLTASKDGWNYVLALAKGNKQPVTKGIMSVGALSRALTTMKHPYCPGKMMVEPTAKVHGTFFGMESINGHARLEVKKLTRLSQ